MIPPVPTPILRFTHIENLSIFLNRNGLHAPNHVPSDGQIYKAAHNLELQAARSKTPIPCGPGGTIHDYVPFYFGERSPMMLRLRSGWVSGYAEGQESLVYLVSTAQTVDASGAKFVFSEGHGYVAYTKWFDRLDFLSEIDWEAVHSRYWGRQNDPTGELKRRKQAEFLIYRFCDWSLIQEIVVFNDRIKSSVEKIMGEYSECSQRMISIKPGWYY